MPALLKRIVIGSLLTVALAVSCAKGSSLDTGDEATGAGAATGAGGAGAASGSGAAAGTGATTGNGPAAGSGGSGGGSTGSSAQGSGGTGGGLVNPCQGVTCVTPPANVCADANHLTVYEPIGTCNLGNCEYASSAVPCPNGCANGACNGDPCIGVSCVSPPANFCTDATHLNVYESPGACNAGNCTYGAHQEFCQNGCINGACSGDPCIGVMCNMPPAKYCSGPNELTVFDVPGTCMNGLCSYSTHTEFCAFGCTNGVCMGDPCIGVTCSTPPANFCSGPNTLRSYNATGTCSNGMCTYPYSDQTCPNGCLNGKCVECTTSANCPSGQWCSNNVCQPCNDNQHCGPTCVNCTATGDFCNAGGTACVDCAIDAQCPAGNYCNAGTCAPCNNTQHCGPTCVACSGMTPTCNGTACVCSAGSCGAYKQCVSGTCVECNTDSSCGSSCTACSAPTPKCLDEGSTSKCVQCLTSADCTPPDTCTANVCGAGCPLPADACITNSGNGQGCTNARIVGRATAGTPSGYSTSRTSCSASNLSDMGGCADSGLDHFYRVFLRQGETVTVTLSTGSSCGGSSWYATLKFLTNSGCSSTACTTLAQCTANTQNTTKSLVASQDGWYIIIADGGSSGEAGTYMINVKITCNSGNCEC